MSLRVPARDGYALGAILYTREQQYDPADAIVFNTGGGLAMQRYRHFLRFLAGSGMPVLAYDYRGIGASRPERLRGFVAGLEDWAEFDQAGAIDFVASRFPGARIASVSHSVGGLIACTAPNAGTVHQYVYLCPHTGYWKDYRNPWRWPMALTWHVAMPLIARTLGYFPGRSLRLGDDLPLRFALQWAGRTSPEFHLGAAGAEVSRGQAMLDRARALRVPGMALTVFDDAFVSEAGLRRFLYAIPEAPVARADIERATVGGMPVGHAGFFSRRHAALWPIVTRFLQTPMASTGDSAQRAGHGPLADA